MSGRKSAFAPSRVGWHIMSWPQHDTPESLTQTVIGEAEQPEGLAINATEQGDATHFTDLQFKALSLG